MDHIENYLQLKQCRPELFADNEAIPLVTEEAALRRFEEESEKSVGVVFDNAPYWQVLGDVARGGKGLYRYCRVVSGRSAGTAAIVTREENGITKFGLLKIFRHATRAFSLEIPRGFTDEGYTPEENIEKELREEIGAQSCRVDYLGSVNPDNGLTSGQVQLYHAELTGVPLNVTREEGIRDMCWVTESELQHMIANNEITDGFTQCAYLRYLLRSQSNSKI